MTTHIPTDKWDFTAKRIGEAEDRTREQFTVSILRHAPGRPGHVYVAQVIANMRANTLSDLQDLIWHFAEDVEGD